MIALELVDNILKYLTITRYTGFYEITANLYPYRNRNFMDDLIILYL